MQKITEMNNELRDQSKEMQNNFDKKSEIKPHIDITYGEYLGKLFENRSDELSKLYMNLLKQESEMYLIQSKLKKKFHSPEAKDSYNIRKYMMKNKEKILAKSEDNINIKLNDLQHLANILRNIQLEFQYKFNSGEHLISPEKSSEKIIVSNYCDNIINTTEIIKNDNIIDKNN